MMALSIISSLPALEHQGRPSLCLAWSMRANMKLHNKIVQKMCPEGITGVVTEMAQTFHIGREVQ